MKHFYLKILGILILFHSCAGCRTSIQRYYTPMPIDNILVLDYEGRPQISQIHDDLNDLILKRAAEDYILIGRADFTGNANARWKGPMLRLGKTLKAEKIDYTSEYARTDLQTEMLIIPTYGISTGTVWGPSGPRSVTMTTSGSTMAPYSYSVQMNNFHVFYFKKLLFPPSFGVFIAEPTDETALLIGTRKAFVITGVVPNKLSWQNDLFKGDVILEVEGQKPTADLLKALGNDPVGKKIKIWRNGAILIKDIIDAQDDTSAPQPQV